MRIQKNQIFEFIELFLTLILGLWFVGASTIAIFWLLGLI